VLRSASASPARSRARPAAPARARLFGVEKPSDHYHSAREVEHFLETHGFRRLHRGYLPLPIPLAPLYLVSAWCRDPRQG
jgi:hypothetical protein